MLKRLITLFEKLISVKGIFVIITTIAYFLNKIDYWYVALAFSIFIGSREAYKLITRDKCAKE